MNDTQAVSTVLPELAIKIDHIAIAVRDLEQSILWYTDVLGFEIIERRETAGVRTGMKSVVLKCGPITFVLVQGTSQESQVSRFIDHYGPGVQHVAIEVQSAEDVVGSLSSNGALMDTGLIRSTGLTQAFLKRDPHSGVMIELIERGGGTFTDGSVSELFKQLEANDSF